MIGPDHPDFENLPRKEQARAYKAARWDIEAIAEELDVSETTVKRWLNPTYERRQKEYRLQWEKTPAGRAHRRRNYGRAQ